MRKNIVMATLLICMVAICMPAQAGGKKKKKIAANAPVSEIVLDQPVLANAGDSTAYLFGTTQSQGLKNYMITELDVDTTYMAAFVQGLMDRVEAEDDDPATRAYNAGQGVGAQIVQFTKSFRNDYYAADPSATISPVIVATAIVEGLLLRSDMSPDSAMVQFRAIMSERQKENLAAQFGGNRQLGEEFLAENKKRDGVIVLPSGLQYRIIERGDGTIPTATQKVKVNYEGRLVDGTVFDSSYKRNEPSTFAVNRVIKGWTEALCKMPVGSKWELYVPYDLAYGEKETGKIKPFSTLIFTIELLEIVE